MLATGDGAHKVENTSGQASLDGQGGTETSIATYNLTMPTSDGAHKVKKTSGQASLDGQGGTEPSIATYLTMSTGDGAHKVKNTSHQVSLDGQGGTEPSISTYNLTMPTGDGAHKVKNTSGQASLDGQGGTEPSIVTYDLARLHDDNGEAVSKTSFEESDSSLGRIDLFTILPPHTVASLKDHLVRVEGALGHDIQLLENKGGEVALNDGDAIALLTDNLQGSKEEPIVFTYARNVSDKMMALGSPSFSKHLTAKSYWGE